MTNKELDEALANVSIEHLPRTVVDDDFPDYCTCEDTEHDFHICPYSEDVDGEEKLCNCCPYCTEECANNI